MEETEDQLADRARKGDEKALGTLLERFGLDLQTQLEGQIGSRYRGKFDAADIMQVTLLEAFLNIRSFAPGGPGSFEAWLRRIAENNLRDAVRELERDKRPPPGKRVELVSGDDSYIALVEQLATTSTTASRVCAREELRKAVDAALCQLPGDYERVLRLYELEGLSGEEVADRMGRSHGAVRMLLARARDRLAEVLGTDSRFRSSSA